jgi:exonuclease III
MLRLFLVLFVLGCTQDIAYGTRRFLVGISWNVNGIAKIRLSEASLAPIREADFVFLQETYSRSEPNCLRLEGFTGHHALSAASSTKPRWGLSTLFKIETFAFGSITRLVWV